MFPCGMNFIAAVNPSAREQGLPSPIPLGCGITEGNTRVGRAHLRLDTGVDTAFWDVTEFRS